MANQNRDVGHKIPHLRNDFDEIIAEMKPGIKKRRDLPDVPEKQGVHNHSCFPLTASAITN